MDAHVVNVLIKTIIKFLWVSLIFVPLGIWKAGELILLFINYL